MHVLDGEQHEATAEIIKAPWCGARNGKWFRCYLCGHKFAVGDRFRFVMSKRFINFFTCAACDGEDVQERWDLQNEEADRRFWWMRREL